jgi:hypothetical protein
MLLESSGANIELPLIEVLSGVGLGAFWLKDQSLLFLSGWACSPDVGIFKSIQPLGFVVKEESEADGTIMPIHTLKCNLEHGPVMIGPLDIGELEYQPNAHLGKGSDHYVLVLSIDRFDQSE